MAIVNTGDFRNKVITISKTVNGESVAGFPKNYNITNAFGSYSALTDSQFAILSDVDYNTRLSDLFIFIDSDNTEIQMSEVNILNSSTGTDTNLCEVPVVPEQRVFRETFPTSQGSTLAALNWQAYAGATAVQVSPTVQNDASASLTQDPSVNAYNPDVATTTGYARLNYSGNTFVNYITEKYTISRVGNKNISKVKLFYGGSNNTSHNISPIIKIGSQWYRYNAQIQNTQVSTSDSSFNSQAEIMIFVIDPLAVNTWREVNFVPGSAYMDGNLVASLPAGDIVAFGINVFDGSTSSRTHRWDSFEIWVK
jgi:hypothetical protein